KLRPAVQLMARASHGRNVSALPRAGADGELAYATLGATEIWSELGPDGSLVVAEGLDVFRVPVPDWLVGRTLAETGLRSRLGCNVIGFVPAGDDRVEAAPPPDQPLPEGASLVMIADAEAQERFFAEDGRRPRRRRVDSN